MKKLSDYCNIKSPDGQLACSKKKGHVGVHYSDMMGDEWTPGGHWHPKKSCICMECMKGFRDGRGG